MAALITSFAASTQAQTFANASFETWHTYTSGSGSLNAPDGWYGVDSLLYGMAPLASLAGFTISPAKQLFQSTVAHTGTYSAEVKSVFVGDTLGNIPGIFSNAQVNINFTGFILGGADPSTILQYIAYTGGTAVTAQVDTVKAWVQLDSATSKDTAIVTATTIKTVAGSSGDSTVVVGLGTYAIVPGSSSFVQIAIPLTYADATTIPEKLIVAFVSSNYQADTIHSGNDLKVDDVSYSYKTNSGTSIVQPLLSENKLLVYPNPTKNQIYFNLNASVKPADFNLSVYDINGRLISTEQLKQAINSKNVSNWSKGTYYYQLNNGKNGQSENGQFIVE